MGTKTLYFQVMDWIFFILTNVTCGSISLLNWCRFRLHKLPQGTKLPPMPPTSSIFGHLQLNEPNFHAVKALQWAKDYGPVYRLRMYFRDVVVLNDFDTIKKFSLNKQMLHRPSIMSFASDYYKGLITMNGTVWRHNRTFCLGTLRNLGFGKSAVERKLAVEFRKLEEEIQKVEGKAVYLGMEFMECAANQLASLFMPRVQRDGIVRAKLAAILKRLFVVLLEVDLYQFWPSFCKHFFSLFSFTSSGRMKNVINDIDDFIINEISDHLQDNGEISFIQAYKEKIDESTRNEDFTYQHRYLVGHIKEFLIGGIDGPSISMQLHMVMFAARQDDIQRRVQREIDVAIGHERLPTWEDRKLMPFTLACVWELERWKRTEPFGLPRGTQEDVVVDNIFIPRGTVVLFNLWAVSRDDSLWRNPHHFDPTRYLRDDGSLIREKPAHHVGFSYGKRSCPGESFAMMQLFLMVAFTLQRYNVHLGEPLSCDLDDPKIDLGVLKRMRLRFERRLRNTIACDNAFE